MLLLSALKVVLQSQLAPSLTHTLAPTAVASQMPLLSSLVVLAQALSQQEVDCPVKITTTTPKFAHPVYLGILYHLEHVLSVPAADQDNTISLEYAML